MTCRIAFATTDKRDTLPLRLSGPQKTSLSPPPPPPSRVIAVRVKGMEDFVRAVMTVWLAVYFWGIQMWALWTFATRLAFQFGGGDVKKVGMEASRQGGDFFSGFIVCFPGKGERRNMWDALIGDRWTQTLLREEGYDSWEYEECGLGTSGTLERGT